MLDCYKLFDYYKAHEKDYPVRFEIMDEGISLMNPYGNSMAYLDSDGSFLVYPSEEMPYELVYSLRDYSDPFNFDFNENNAKSVLDTFVDCVYLVLWKLRKDIDEMIYTIDGGK